MSKWAGMVGAALTAGAEAAAPFVAMQEESRLQELRAKALQKFEAEQNRLNRQHEAGQNQLNRQHEAGQNQLNRQHRTSERIATQGNEAEQNRLNRQHEAEQRDKSLENNISVAEIYANARGTGGSGTNLGAKIAEQLGHVQIKPADVTDRMKVIMSNPFSELTPEQAWNLSMLQLTSEQMQRQGIGMEVFEQFLLDNPEAGRLFTGGAGQEPAAGSMSPVSGTANQPGLAQRIMGGGAEPETQAVAPVQETAPNQDPNEPPAAEEIAETAANQASNHEEFGNNLVNTGGPGVGGYDPKQGARAAGEVDYEEMARRLLENPDADISSFFPEAEKVPILNLGLLRDWWVESRMKGKEALMGQLIKQIIEEESQGNMSESKRLREWLKRLRNNVTGEDGDATGLPVQAHTGRMMQVLGVGQGTRPLSPGMVGDAVERNQGALRGRNRPPGQ